MFVCEGGVYVSIHACRRFHLLFLGDCYISLCRVPRKSKKESQMVPIGFVMFYSSLSNSHYDVFFTLMSAYNGSWIKGYKTSQTQQEPLETLV